MRVSDGTSRVIHEFYAPYVKADKIVYHLPASIHDWTRQPKEKKQ